MPIIPNIYTLDLENINNTINAINSEFDARRSGKTSSNGKASSNIIMDEVAGASTTEFVKEGLKISKGIYDIHFEATAGATTDYYLYFNRDKTGANYRGIYLYSANGAAAQANGVDTAYIGENEANGRFSLTGRISIDKANDSAVIWYRAVRQPTDLFIVGSTHWEDFQAFDEVNSISIVASVTGHLGKGSHCRIWEVSKV